MRSALVAAAFAAGALAVPLQEREVVYVTDIAYATEYVTVTAGDVAPTEAPASSSTSCSTSSSSSSHYGHKKGSRPQQGGQQGYGWTSSWSWATTYSAEEAAPAPTSSQEQAVAYSSVEEQAPAYTPPAAYSSVQEEAPAPTYEAPQETYEAPATQPASSQAPASTPSAEKPTDYQGFVEYHHNVHRANHSAPDLTWNETLAATAEKIGQLCSYEHMMYVPYPSLDIPMLQLLTIQLGPWTVADTVRTSPLVSRPTTSPLSSPSSSTTARSRPTLTLATTASLPTSSTTATSTFGAT